MNRIKINSIKVLNFKGTKEAEYTFNGESAIVRGANATGKTTIADAIAWVLSDQDSLGQKTFEVRHHDLIGQGVDHRVDVNLDINGKNITLTRTLKEKWQKTRGSTVAEFRGTGSTFEIDGVPLKEKDFRERVASLLPMDAWALLTNTKAFAALHWKTRRDLLVEIAGEATQADIIALDERLEELPRILGDATVSDHLAKVRASKRKINDELQTLPGRMDEVTRAMEAFEPIQIAPLERAVTDAKRLHAQRVQELNDAKAGLEDIGLRRAVADAEDALRAVERKLTNEARGPVFGLEADVTTARRDHANATTRHATAVTNKAAAGRELEAAQETLNRLRKTVIDKKAELEVLQSTPAQISARAVANDVQALLDAVEPFTTLDELHHDAFTPALKTAADRVQFGADSGELLAEANTQRAATIEALNSEIERITAEGIAARDAVHECERALEDAVRELEISRMQTAERKAALDAAQAKLDAALNAPAPDFTKDFEWDAANHRLADARAALEAHQSGDTSNIDALKLAAGEAAQSVDAAQEALASAKASLQRFEADTQRLAQLQSDEKQLAANFEQLDREQFLCELFTQLRAKANHARVNNLFELAAFKLHHEQTNGGIEEVCEITDKKGVPFGNLNTAAQIQIALDIINVLQAHHEAELPVFVDNRESVTVLPSIETQTISLVVDPNFSSISVEPTGGQKEAA